MQTPKVDRYSTHLIHNRITDLVHINMYGRKGGSKHRRRVLASSLTVRRTDLRLLCDMIHDYADQIDRGGAFRSLASEALHDSTGSDLSLPEGVPHRAHARARGGER
jgi:hypothetical protein